jgi:hypothetical protein
MATFSTPKILSRQFTARISPVVLQEVSFKYPFPSLFRIWHSREEYIRNLIFFSALEYPFFPIVQQGLLLPRPPPVVASRTIPVFQNIFQQAG